MECPTGLVNLGNTCFLNTALQILSACSMFQDSLMQLRVPQSVDTDSGLFLKEYLSFQRVSHHMRSPLKLKNYLGRVYSQYSTFEQQDTNECILRIIDIVESALKPRRSPPPPLQPRSPGNPTKALRVYGAWAWKCSMREICSQTRPFYGQFREVITCKTCHLERNNFTLFNSLAILDTSQGLVTGISQATTHSEYIDGYACSRCKRSTRCRKKCLVWKLPKILVMQFPYKQLSGKLETHLMFNDDGIERRFELKALGCHEGPNTSCGHYYAYVSFNRKFYRLDDETCTQIDDPSHISTENVYTMLYQRSTSEEGL